MAKKPKTESLALEDLGNLDDASHDELLALRQRLIEDVDHIHGENARLTLCMKALNEEKHGLQHQLAVRAKALRAVKHRLTQLGIPTTSSARREQASAQRNRLAPNTAR